jgi:drug/metabolite transporter (DMT)-like permease
MWKNKTNKKVVWAYVALLSVVLIWSLSPILANLKVVTDGYSPGMLIALRSLFAAVALALINAKKLKEIDREYFKVAIPSGVALSAGTICQMVGYRYDASPGESAVLENLALIVIPILLFVFTRKKPSWMKIAAAILCFIGSAIIALEGSGGDLFSVSLGKWLASIAGILYGVNFVITGTYARKLNSGVFVFIQICIQTVAAFAYAFIGEKLLMGDKGIFACTFDWLPFMIVGVMGVVATGICWALRANCLKTIPVMIASVIMPFSTVLTGVWSVIGGMESLTWNLWVGGLIVLASIFIAQIGDKEEPDKAKIVEVESITEQE